MRNNLTKNSFLGVIVLTLLCLGYYAGVRESRKSYIIIYAEDTITVSPHGSIHGLFVAHWNGGGEVLDSCISLGVLFGDKFISDKSK